MSTDRNPVVEPSLLDASAQEADGIGTYFARPALGHYRPTHGVVLPEGRTTVRMEVTGWGRIDFGESRQWFWRSSTIVFLARVDEPISVSASNLFGRCRRVVTIRPNVERSPARVPVGDVRLPSVPSFAGAPLPSPPPMPDVLVAIPAVCLPRPDTERLSARMRFPSFDSSSMDKKLCRAVVDKLSHHDAGSGAPIQTSDVQVTLRPRSLPGDSHA